METTARALAPNTPVIVGVGFHQEKHDDPAASAEPYALMVEAVRRAAADAGSTALLGAIESIAVPQGMWEYRNPGKLVADALGCPGAKSILAGLGVLQLQLVSDLCSAIANGERHVGVVTAGEAKYRRLRSTITGQPVADTVQGKETPPPDEHQTSVDLWCSDLEARRGLTSPVEFFAIIESALRHERGLGIERHRDEIAELYSRFSAIAAANPHAWRREQVPADAIRDPSPRNAMLAFPYTKLHASQWNVNQAVAIIVCSAGRARALGLDETRWIYPLSAAQSKHVVPLAQMRTLQGHLGTVRSSERACALAGLDMRDVTAAELYSCFPAAIQSFARDLRVPAGVPWTVTGSMAFAGGPFNNASIEGVARMVEVLREGAGLGAARRRVGLVSNLSGIFSKQACALFSNEPNPAGYRFEDVTAEVAAEDPPVPLRDDYTGPATVVGYTVVFQGDTPSHAIAICDLPDGARTVVRSEDPAVLAVLMREEYCGRVVEVGAGGAVALRGSTA
jgi:acetyl-CoA C-acetyltransferase